jgi:hypothetical protein
MSYVKLADRRRAVHQCRPPGFLARLRAHVDFGTVWQCDTCGAKLVWTSYNGYTGPHWARAFPEDLAE